MEPQGYLRLLSVPRSFSINLLRMLQHTSLSSVLSILLQPYSRSCCCASSFAFSVVLLPVTGVQIKQMKHVTAPCSNTQTHTTCKTFQAEQYPGLYPQMTSNFSSQVLTVSFFCWFQEQPVQCELSCFGQLLLSLLINLLG